MSSSTQSGSSGLLLLCVGALIGVVMTIFVVWEFSDDPRHSEHWACRPIPTDTELAKACETLGGSFSFGKCSVATVDGAIDTASLQVAPVSVEKK